MAPVDCGRLPGSFCLLFIDWTFTQLKRSLTTWLSPGILCSFKRARLQRDSCSNVQHLQCDFHLEVQHLVMLCICGSSQLYSFVVLKFIAAITDVVLVMPQSIPTAYIPFGQPPELFLKAIKSQLPRAKFLADSWFPGQIWAPLFLLSQQFFCLFLRFLCSPTLKYSHNLNSLVIFACKTYLSMENIRK